MSARQSVLKAMRTGYIPSEGLNQYTCCCHPRSWGAKKGLRRARRRVGKDIIRRELEELLSTA